VRTRRLLPGILADSVALADAGWETVTLSRGTAATLARIHRPGDRADRMTAAGIAATAPLVAAVVERLAGGGRDATQPPAAHPPISLERR
jgi:hypothetical protein